MIGLGLGSQPTTECGIFGSYQSLNLDGNSDYVDVPLLDILPDPNNSLSVSCWINIVQNDGDTSQQIIKVFSDTDNQFQFFYHKHEQQFRTTLKTQGGTNRVATFDPGGVGYTGWQHFAATYTISSGTCDLNFYRNGSLVERIRVESGQGDWEEDVTVMRIGANQDGTGAFTDGQVDQVGFWNTVLPATTIAAIYNGGVMRDLTTQHTNYTQTANLIGYYQFEGNFQDSSNLQAHGTAVGTAGFSTNQPS